MAVLITVPSRPGEHATELGDECLDQLLVVRASTVDVHDHRRLRKDERVVIVGVIRVVEDLTFQSEALGDGRWRRPPPCFYLETNRRSGSSVFLSV
jgi:hypothetical protein